MSDYREELSISIRRRKEINGNKQNNKKEKEISKNKGGGKKNRKNKKLHTKEYNHTQICRNNIYII